MTRKKAGKGKGKDNLAFFAVRLEQGMLDEMDDVQREVGIPKSEQMRRALADWLRTHGRTLRGKKG